MSYHKLAAQEQNERGRTKESICTLLRIKGIEPTVLRVKIATVLMSKIQHLTITQIRDRLEHNNIMISNTAMINTLCLFSRHHFIQEIFVDAKTIFYDSNASDHPHFYNAQTGDLVNIPTSNINIYEAASSQEEDRVGMFAYK